MKYVLVCGVLRDQQLVLAPTQLGLLKQNLVMRDAWEIGPNDVDLVAIREDDDPIIPDEQKDPPVRLVLKMWRQQKERQGKGRQKKRRRRTRS